MCCVYSAAERCINERVNHMHTVMPGTKLQEHSGSDKAWVWSTVDFAEEEQKMELFCMRFANADRTCVVCGTGGV